jgi:hypothetical protein
MPLPLVDLPTDSIEIGGEKVEYRALSREEALRLNRFKEQTAEDLDAGEIFMLSCSVGVTEEEAAEWRRRTDAGTVDRLLQAIATISGLVPDPERPDDPNR